MKKKEFEFTFEHTIEDVATEIFLPNLHFGDGFTIQLSDGSYEIDGQTLKYFHTNNLEKHTVIIKSI
jgi:hypothetical protein